MAEEKPTYLEPREVADRFKISENTLAGWRRKNTGPNYKKFGGKVLYLLEDLIKYEKENTIELNGLK